MALGVSAVTLRSRRPAPPHNTMASGMLGINFAPRLGKRFVINLLRFIHDYVAAPVGEGKGNAQQVLQASSQLAATFRRYEEEHEAASAGAQQLAAQSPGTAPRLVDVIDAGIADSSCQRSLDFPC